mmetsp:Transcript_10525/g.20900  ORF Transcript_10525/g.20900 Transcript_10525/m.20900 type:complete len:411 (+) Transcript_10525:1340-2572(+)
MRHDFHHLLRCNLFLEEGSAYACSVFRPVHFRLHLLDGLLQLRDSSVTKVSRGIVTPFALSPVGLGLEVLDLLAHGAQLLDAAVLVLPLHLERAELLLDLGQLLLDVHQALLRALVVLAAQRDALDLELLQPALQLVDLLRRGVELAARLGTGLVDEVDGLVGQEALGDVPLRERRGRNERGVEDAHAVVRLVAVLEPAQDGDRVGDGRLLDVHLLETTFEGRVLLDVLAILAQRRGTDTTELASGKHRLKHVGSIHRPLGLSRSHDEVDLVNEKDDPAFGLLDLGEDAFDTALELTAELGSGDEQPDVQRPHLRVERLRDVPVHDALRQAFNNGSLTHTGLTDKHGVVLRAAGQDLDHLTDLLVSSDDGVDLALSRLLAHVDGVLGQCVPLFLGVLVHDLLSAAHLLYG